MANDQEIAEMSIKRRTKTLLKFKKVCRRQSMEEVRSEQESLSVINEDEELQSHEFIVGGLNHHVNFQSNLSDRCSSSSMLRPEKEAVWGPPPSPQPSSHEFLRGGLEVPTKSK
ncbi:hypothetical protein C1H46_044603 [Malus baccata]|uniref:Uncharacterized protein n=1 Tax=Malus baccata TaxID=106549 RepID=A0A540K6K5_MALBA|nr:hypothetical protein C1H46_044603 [Malus baccata]